MSTTPELLSILREELDDTVYPYGWPSAYLLGALTEAEQQACRRAYLIIDKDTASVCMLSMSASVQVYSLHSKVLQVRRLALTSSPENPLLGPVTRFEFDTYFKGWVSATGLPVAFMTEANRNGVEITFDKAPLSAVAASLVVARLPLSALVDASSSIPEIPEMYHRDLLDWAKHVAYLKNDSDTLNMTLAQYYEEKFTAKFGPLPSASDERKRRMMPPRPRAFDREFGT